MTLAAVDRLIHHATILELNVESYRRRTAVERRKGPGRPARQSTPPLIDAPRQSTCENLARRLRHRDADQRRDTIDSHPDRGAQITLIVALQLRAGAGFGNPRVAMTVLLHKLASDAFGRRSREGCLEAEVREVYTPVQAGDLGESGLATSVAARHARWSAEVPTEDEALWDWLVELDTDYSVLLTASCVYSETAAAFRR